MTNNEWDPKVIMVQSICDYARVLTPCQPHWAKQPIYIIALRLSTPQFTRLQSLGCKSVAKPDQSTGTCILRYNFKRNTLSKNGNPLPPLPVMRIDKQPWPISKLIGNGSEVIVALEYGDHTGGEGYSAGVSFRIGAVQVVNHIPWTEPVIEQDLSILDKFEAKPLPAGYVDEPAERIPQQVQVQPVHGHVPPKKSDQMARQMYEQLANNPHNIAVPVPPPGPYDNMPFHDDTEII